jgi:hypothetical protein
VAHISDPRYSRGRDQENCGLKPARANSSLRPYLKKPFTKKGLVEWLKVTALSSSSSTRKKKKKKSVHQHTFKETNSGPVKVGKFWVCRFLGIKSSIAVTALQEC